MTQPSIERRQRPRKTSDPPLVGILYTDPILFRSSEDPPKWFVDVLNRSDGGALVRSQETLYPGKPLYLRIYDPHQKSWILFETKATWNREDGDNPGCHLLGLELKQVDTGSGEPQKETSEDRQKPAPGDYEFFRRIRMLRFLPRNAVCPVLNRVFHRRIKIGERFLRQGEPGDAFYVIQRGSCAAIVEKNGEMHSVARLHEGDIVGEMAILTGEPRSSHVEAETDMEIWGLTPTDFETIEKQYPDLRTFLTELVADRFSSREVTADRRIGKYVITDIIGRGGYSIVYKGIHGDLDMPVAVKMLKHDLAMSPDFLDKFRNEAKLIAQFNHSNIIRVYDIEERYRTVFIVMEYLEGASLRQLIGDRKNVPFKDTIQILLQVCSGLIYAHEHGIIHLDIKPANIFVLPNGQVKILDFGISSPCKAETLDDIGTLAYQSPDRILCRPVDERADIYSLGIVAYEMVTGKRPYPDDDLPRIMEAHLNQDIPDPAEHASGLPEGLRRFILRASSRDPEKRYPSAFEARLALQSLANELAIKTDNFFTGKGKMKTLVLFHRDEDQPALKRLVEEFSRKLHEAGMTVKADDLDE